MNTSLTCPRLTKTHSTIALAALTSFSLSASVLTAPAPANAQTDAVDSVILGVGATETDVMFTWMSTLEVRDEYAILAPTADMDGDKFPQSAQKIKAQQELTRVARYANDVKVSDLEPDTEYTYKVGSDSHGWSTNETFKTGHSGDNWNFFFYGDPQIGAGDRPADITGWHNTTDVSTAQFPDASFLLSAGDQVESVLQAEHRGFKSPAQLRSYPTAVNNGNHDVIDYQLYRQNYSWPNVTNEHAERNYFFEHNNALIISLDGNQHLPSQIDRHADYVKDVVAQHGGDKDWIITTFHQPTFSQAYHMSDPGAVRLRESLSPALSEAGVDLVLNGHDHIYTRTHLMDGNTPVVPDALPAQGDVLYPKDNEVLYLTGNSSSGSKYYSFWNDGTTYEDMTLEESRAQGLTQDWTALWNQDYTPDYSNIQVSPEELTVTTYNVADGSVVDEVTLSKGAPALPEETDTPEEPDTSDEPETPEAPGDDEEQDIENILAGSSLPSGSSISTTFRAIFALLMAIGAEWVVSNADTRRMLP